ncbi:hypothetical protein P3T36_004180, partial [Kitasatospora sp. MAP12-15]
MAEASEASLISSRSWSSLFAVITAWRCWECSRRSPSSAAPASSAAATASIGEAPAGAPATAPAKSSCRVPAPANSTSVDPSGVLGPQVAGADALETVDQFGQGDLRRVVHQQVDVIALAVEFPQLRTEALAYVPHDRLAARQHLVVEDLTPVLGDEHQV